MWNKLSQPWIPLEKISEVVQLEPALFTLFLTLLARLIYRTLMKEISEERHQALIALFRNLWIHTVISAFFFSTFWAMTRIDSPTSALERVIAYFGFVSLIAGTVVIVKVSRIFMFEYLFLSHMRVAVPLLLVNLFTLLLSILIGGWIATEIFSVRLAPVLATSAIFSLVLGLALQDTLGNLFAGVALQFDKPYEIGDWIEVTSGGQKWAGQVEEISWRATLLIGLTDEKIIFPNRVVSQAEIANFSGKGKPFIRSQNFKLHHSVNIPQARDTLVRAALRSKRIHVIPEPKAFVTEASDSWLNFRLIYFIDNYGSQFTIADEVITFCMEELKREQLEIAPNRIQVQTAAHSV